MHRLTPAIAIILIALLAGCHDRPDRGGSTDHATTQPGATGEVSLPGRGGPATCAQLPNAQRVRAWLKKVPSAGEVGGIAGGLHEWAAVVDREGRLCVIVASDADPSAPWPGSQGVAKAKAFTANAFSSDSTPMSTARRYTWPARPLAVGRWCRRPVQPPMPQCAGCSRRRRPGLRRRDHVRR